MYTFFIHPAVPSPASHSYFQSNHALPTQPCEYLCLVRIHGSAHFFHLVLSPPLASVKSRIHLFPFCFMLACLLAFSSSSTALALGHTYIQPTSLAHLTDGSYGSIPSSTLGFTSHLLHKLSLLLLVVDTEISCCFIWSLFPPYSRIYCHFLIFFSLLFVALARLRRR